MQHSINRRRFIGLTAGATAMVTGLNSNLTTFAQAEVSTSITLDGSGTGRTFDGIGAISGGGGNSRLLIDYPDPYRSQILDYLFKPNYGANLHILKVEVGGDTNSTDGSEASFMHTASDQNFNRGYEWWLMEQAKARNPNIKLYGLAWGAPGWIGTTGATVYDTSNPFWSLDMINYYVDWIKGAQSEHGLTIDYIGGWNERGYNKSFYENLKSALTSNGLSTKIVGADSDWTVADAMVSDSTFAAAIDIVGAHYPCTGGDGGTATSCTNTTNAKSLGKQLWASENGSQDYNTGATAMSRAINRGYIDGLMTSFINWPLIASLYPNLPYNTCGLMVANQPWSGTYSIGKQLWVTAQTTQFTQPGWQYITSASGYLGGSDSNGSYVTLKSTNGTDYSVIIETMDATASQTVSFTVANGLSTGTVYVWSTNVASNDPSTYFVQQSSITPSSGAYSITLQAGYVYTLTTTTGQSKGSAVGPINTALALPYSDNFDGYTLATEAQYFSDMNGGFEIVASGGSRSGQSLRQMAPTAPITWDNASTPYTLLGELSWTNYTVSCDVFIEQAGAAQLLGRVGSQTAFSPAHINAYYLSVSTTGAWSIYTNTTGGTITTLSSGTVTALGTSTWHTLALGFNGSTITASIDGTTVSTITSTTYSSGMVGLGVSGWQNVQFDNFSVTPASSSNSSGSYYEIINKNSSLVMDVTSSSTSSGAAIIQYADHQGTNQQWQLVSAGSGYTTIVNRNSGLVLDVPSSSTSTGTQLDQATNASGANQQWQINSTGSGYYTITNRHSSLNADVSGSSTASSAAVVQNTASSSSSSQQWIFAAVPTAGITYQLVNRNSGKVMDVSGESTSTGGIIIQYDNHGGTNQQWTFLSAGSGYFTLVNVHSGLVLDVPNQSTSTGVQLDQWTSNSGTNQQWEFVSAGGGYYNIIARGSGLTVDISGSSTANSAAVIQNTASSSSTSQQWQLVAIS